VSVGASPGGRTADCAQAEAYVDETVAKLLMLWQLLHSPLASCGAVWQVLQLLGGAPLWPVWQLRHLDMVIGST